MTESHCLFFLWPGFNSLLRRSISRNFSLADHTLSTCLEPAWQKMAQSPLNDTTQPLDSEEEGRSSAMDRQRLTKKSIALLSQLASL